MKKGIKSSTDITMFSQKLFEHPLRRPERKILFAALVNPLVSTP